MSTIHVDQIKFVIKINLKLEKPHTSESLVYYVCCQFLSRRKGREHTAQQILLVPLLLVLLQFLGAVQLVLANEKCGSGTCHLWHANSVCLSLTPGTQHWDCSAAGWKASAMLLPKGVVGPTGGRS